MKLSLPRPQNSVEALFSLSYMLLKLAFWQACMKWVHISARTAPLVLIRVVLLVWRAPSAEDPAPPGRNSIQMPAIWQHQHCLILCSWLASINNMADSTGGISKLSFAHLDFGGSSKVIWRPFQNWRNLTTKSSVGPDGSRKRERAVRNQACALKGYLMNLWFKCRISKNLNMLLCVCVCPLSMVERRSCGSGLFGGICLMSS